MREIETREVRTIHLKLPSEEISCERFCTDLVRMVAEKSCSIENF